ncbi:Prp4 [Entamoeba marina]
MSQDKLIVYSLDQLLELRSQKLNINIPKRQKGQHESSSPAEFFERYRWIMNDVILIEKSGEKPMHGSILYDQFLQGKLLLHECTVKSADSNIPFVLQLKKYVDIYKKILDIDKAKEDERKKQKEEEMNMPKAAEPVYKKEVDDVLFDPLDCLGDD